ncbi:uncharacterized protein LOC132721196 isoform X2 [Ruditapes philippinarum]|uniref:uncharacterized protein LOC132721196 isoform X2 n=1 Tax=Ruditapes philippinarum TaxID=129788 RepID=UPI00295B40A8|nr:uncharacterized protein LOC132721196 isoform X2 [Ruditapes philippinarum]
MAEKMQVREKTGVLKGKVNKRKLSPESDDEMPTSRKMKCESFMENISPDCDSPDSADSRKICDSFNNRRKYLHFGPRKKDKLKKNVNIMVVPPKTTNGRHSLEKLKTTLQKNWKMLKEKLEPTALAEKLQAKKILSDEAIENINKCLSRQGKNDTLIQELCSIEPNSANSCIDYEATFVSLLNDTSQKDVDLQLYHPVTNVVRQKCQDMPQDGHRDLINFNHQQRETLLEEVEPKIILEELIANSCISSKEKREIATTPKRRERVKLLLKKIESSTDIVADQIVRCITNACPNLTGLFHPCSSNTGQQNHLTNEKGSRLNIKISIETKAVQDPNEHDDPVKTLQMRKSVAEEIERKIVHNLEENPNRLEDMFENCLIGIDKIKFACVKIYLRALSSKSLSKLVAYANTGAFKKQIASLIDQSGHELERDSEICIEISEGWSKSEQNETECLCNLDRRAIRKNFKLLSDKMKCSKIINRILESHLITKMDKAFLMKIKTYDLKAMKKQLMHYLLKEELPKIMFCILEDEIIRTNGSSIIRTILTGIYIFYTNIQIKIYVNNDIVFFKYFKFVLYQIFIITFILIVRRPVTLILKFTYYISEHYCLFPK